MCCMASRNSGSMNLSPICCAMAIPDEMAGIAYLDSQGKMVYSAARSKPRSGCGSLCLHASLSISSPIARRGKAHTDISPSTWSQAEVVLIAATGAQSRFPEIAFTFVPQSQVAEELRELQDIYGADHVWFGDDVFALDHRWTRELAHRSRTTAGRPYLSKFSRVPT